MLETIESTTPTVSDAFERATSGYVEARNKWQVIEGGPWRWQSDGVRAATRGFEWSALRWEGWSDFRSPELRNFIVEVTVSGKAEAAGLSFGPYKDFLASLDATCGPRQLQLEVDADIGCWAFRVDGQLMGRAWWDADVKSVEDLLSGTLTFKCKQAQSVVFQNLTLRPLLASCRLSVIVTCYRFVQRLRAALRNWCHQDLPSGAFEILVVNPESPDGTHEHVAAVARSFPHIRVREVAVGADLITNKGAMINRAFASSRGEWIWLTDADCLFAPNAAAHVLQQIQQQPNYLFYGQRRYLSGAQTDALLAGRVDGLHDFAELAAAANARRPENAPWGYTQIVHRRVFQRVPYREGVNHYAHSDGIFTDDCKRIRVHAKQLDGLFCLHMDHPFSWYGTDVFL